jgi:predicted RNA-binding protein with PIN domain
MSLHYVLDGYNVTHQIPGLSTLTLEGQRQRLFQLLENQRPQGSLRNQVTIVYDGRSGFGSLTAGVHPQVIFSCEESADDRIKRIVAEATNRKNMIVVTNDRDIQYYVRALGAQCITVHEFFGRRGLATTDQKLQPKISKGSEKKEISKTLESKITSELSELWLGKKKKYSKA